MFALIGTEKVSKFIIDGLTVIERWITRKLYNGAMLSIVLRKG
jgi:hypothetical protein